MLRRNKVIKYNWPIHICNTFLFKKCISFRHRWKVFVLYNYMSTRWHTVDKLILPFRTRPIYNSAQVLCRIVSRTVNWVNRINAMRIDAMKLMFSVGVVHLEQWLSRYQSVFISTPHHWLPLLHLAIYWPLLLDTGLFHQRA